MSSNTNAIQISTETVLQATVEVAVYRRKEVEQMHISKPHHCNENAVSFEDLRAMTVKISVL
jgi:hypothetical protein